MKKRIYVLLTAGISLIVLASAGRAQDEQWLQYHCQREAEQIEGNTGRTMPEITPERPHDVELPQFETQQQFFAQWATPMVKSGRLPIALDKSPENGLWDRLYIDSNGNGQLNDEEAVKAHGMKQYETLFGPVRVVFEGEDGPIVYHLNCRFYNDGQTRRLYISSGCWYEGDITVEGTKKHCVLIDQNVNGTFNDKALEAHKCDRIRIGGKKGRSTSHVGKYVDIDGVLYEPEIARDGAYIKLTKAENVKFGNILLPETITEFSASGENGLFTLKPEKGTGSLPTGKYRLNYWTAERKDDQGQLWKLKGSGSSAKSSFEIKHAKQTQLSIGEPVISLVSARKSNGTFSFSHELKGRLDERIELTRQGAQPQAPKLRIKNKDGTYDRTYSFSYG